MYRVLIVIVLGCCLAAAQSTKVDLQNQSRGVDFSSAPYTKPAKTGAALPPACTTGEAYVLTTAVPGANLFICTATNTWTLQGTQGPAGPQGPQGPQGPAGPALGFTPLNAADLGQPGGPAKLGSDGKVIALELPDWAGSQGPQGPTGPTGPAGATGAQGPAGPMGPQGPAGPPGSGGGVSDHTQLSHLDFASSGHTGFQAALTYIPLDAAVLGQANGAAKLGSDGKVLASELPAATGGQVSVAFSTEQVTGDGARQTFTLSAIPLAGSLTVAVNGQIQEAGAIADYTLAGAAVNFTATAIPANGDRISFHYAVAGTGTPPVGFATEQATGDGVQTVFHLTNTPAPGALTVAVNGQIQEQGALADYTVAGDTVTFNTPSAPGGSARISFRYGYANNGGIPITMSQLPAAIPSGLATLGADGKLPAAQLPVSAPATGTQTFTNSASWTVPAGVMRVYVQAWGAGSGGWGGQFDSGSGGSGGGYADNWCLVAPGTSIAVTVGAPGAGGIPGTRGPQAGGDSSFDSCVTALGGAPGADADKFIAGYDASLGQAAYYAIPDGQVFPWYVIGHGWHPTDKVYTPLRLDMGGIGGYAITGGAEANGATGSPAIKGGGGGGSGAKTAAGNSVAGGAGGTSARGGVGGSGGGVANGAYVACTSGAVPGGGGGGAGSKATTLANGCDGGRGQVVLTW